MPAGKSSNNEAEITLGLLRAVESDESITQRTAAEELGVALGLINAYLKRCVHKGYIKVKLVPRNRYAYYLTPKGFAEKSRLIAEFFSQSLSLFRQAQGDYGRILEKCVESGWTRLCLCGVSDLTEILVLCAQEKPVEIVCVYDPDYSDDWFRDVPVIRTLPAENAVDALVLTDLNDAQAMFKRLVETRASQHVLAPPFLEVHDANTRQTQGVP